MNDVTILLNLTFIFQISQFIFIIHIHMLLWNEIISQFSTIYGFYATHYYY